MPKVVVIVIYREIEAFYSFPKCRRYLLSRDILSLKAEAELVI